MMQNVKNLLYRKDNQTRIMADSKLDYNRSKFSSSINQIRNCKIECEKSQDGEKTRALVLSVDRMRLCMVDIDEQRR